jgi:hypothetical protein
MIKKILMTLAAILVLAAAGLGGFAWHIYKKDFGVTYKGRARLHYNWNYYFAELPSGEGTFKGKEFSYKYPVFDENDGVRVTGDDSYELSEDGRRFLSVLLEVRVPEPIRAELKKNLEAAEAVKPSEEFIEWLYFDTGLPPQKKDRGYYSKFFDVGMEKIKFKLGGEGLRITFRGKTNDFSHMVFVTGFTPGGQVFRSRTRFKLNMSEQSYRAAFLDPASTYGYNVGPKQDVQSEYFLKRFLATFEFKRGGNL